MRQRTLYYARTLAIVLALAVKVSYKALLSSRPRIYLVRERSSEGVTILLRALHRLRTLKERLHSARKEVRGIST